jgi:hypothetical protein
VGFETSDQAGWERDEKTVTELVKRQLVAVFGFRVVLVW